MNYSRAAVDTNAPEINFPDNLVVADYWPPDETTYVWLVDSFSIEVITYTDMRLCLGLVEIVSHVM